MTGLEPWWPVRVPEPERADPDVPEALVGEHVYMDLRDPQLSAFGHAQAADWGLPPSPVCLAGRVEAARWASDETVEVQLSLLGAAGHLTRLLLGREQARLTLLVGQTTRYRERVLRVLVKPVQTPVQTPGDRTDG